MGGLSSFISTGDIGVFWSCTQFVCLLWHVNWCFSFFFLFLLASLFCGLSLGSCFLSVICRGSLTAAVITQAQIRWEHAHNNHPRGVPADSSRTSPSPVKDEPRCQVRGREAGRSSLLLHYKPKLLFLNVPHFSIKISLQTGVCLVVFSGIYSSIELGKKWQLFSEMRIFCFYSVIKWSFRVLDCCTDSARRLQTWNFLRWIKIIIKPKHKY